MVSTWAARPNPKGLSPSEAQAGMAEMSEKFRQLGSQVYVDVAAVKESNSAL